MKALLRPLFLFGLLIASYAPAELKFPEQCWTEDKHSFISDGHFSVHVDTSALTKEQTLQTLRDLNRSLYLQPSWFPSVSEDLNTVVLTLKAGNQEEDESRADFQKKVNAVALEFSRLPGVKIACEIQMIPHPSTTGSN